MQSIYKTAFPIPVKNYILLSMFSVFCFFSLGDTCKCSAWWVGISYSPASAEHPNVFPVQRSWPLPSSPSSLVTNLSPLSTQPSRPPWGSSPPCLPPCFFPQIPVAPLYLVPPKPLAPAHSMASSSHPPNSLSPHPNHGFQVLSRGPVLHFAPFQKNIILSSPLQVWKANSLDTEKFFRAKKNSKLPLGFSWYQGLSGLFAPWESFSKN